jgi:hypothetical protein
MTEGTDVLVKNPSVFSTMSSVRGMPCGAELRNDDFDLGLTKERDTGGDLTVSRSGPLLISLELPPERRNRL